MSIYVGDKLVSGQIDINEIVQLAFDAVYPIDSYAFGPCPSLGTWEEVEGDKAIWIKSGTADGTNISQSLPKPTITSSFTGQNASTGYESVPHTHTRGNMEIEGHLNFYWSDYSTWGAMVGEGCDYDNPMLQKQATGKHRMKLKASNNWTGSTDSQNTSHTHDITAKGSVASSVDTAGAYGTGTKVQPDALVMRVWKRLG